MNFCIPKNLVDSFLEKLKTGEITPEKLTDMTSKERHEYFSNILGEVNAQKVNALFESKLLLKNQQQGIINWAKQVSGIKPEVKRDILSRAQNMTEVLQPKDLDNFLGDLVSQRFGFGVTMEEAGRIADLSKTVANKKALIPENSPIGSKERLEYGTVLTLFKDYVGNLKLEAKKLSLKELLISPLELIKTIAGTTKSIVSSLDNSFFGRQGFVTLVNQPDIWIKNFAKSWGDIGTELKGIDAMLPIKADVFSRPNALNGKYKAQGIDIGLESEEAFPSSLPEKIPLLGRLYKASESAYNGAALRFRADLADRYIEYAESMGVNTLDKEVGIGLLVNSMTGRGNMKLPPNYATVVNVAIFSIRYLKSQFDVLTAHALDKKMDPKIKKEAAKNIFKVIGVIAGVLTIAKLLDPDSVELDPKSSDFGKIRVGRKREIKINVTAGMNSLVTLSSRIIPSMHNGKFGLWYKNAKGKYVRTDQGKFGVPNPMDFLSSFIQGKASPLARTVMDSLKGQNIQREKTTIGGEITTAVTPIPIQNMFQLAQSREGADPLLFALLTALDLLGINVNLQEKSKKK